MSDVQIKEILRRAALELEIEDHEININMDSNLGDGIMADVYAASITDKSNKQETKVVVKKAPSTQGHRALCLIDFTFKNEIHFYSQIRPQMKSLVQNESILTPKYVISEDTVPEEMIVLRDLLAEGYEMKNRADSIDEKHVRAVFKAYGQFHATSMCLKAQKKQEFDNLMKSFTNVWEINASEPTFVNAYKALIQSSVNEALKEHTELKTRLESYINNFPQNLLDSINYNGQYGTLLHGDSWANSVMFKYSNKEKTEIDSVRLFDFQVARYGSPVHDLSYFLFIGAADLKENFDSWESLLDAYHEAFSARCTALKKDPKVLLPREVLSAEWRLYAKSSMLLSMMLLKIKYASDAEIKKQSETLKTNPDSLPTDKLVHVEYDQALFNKRFLNIVEHLNNINAL